MKRNIFPDLDFGDNPIKEKSQVYWVHSAFAIILAVSVYAVLKVVKNSGKKKTAVLRLIQA